MKKMKAITKIFLVLFVGIMTLISSIYDVNAANTITMGGAKKIEGYVAGTYFTTKETTSGVYAYCLDIHKATAKNTTATYVATRDAGFAAIIKNGYPHKSFTGDWQKDYYITQTAIWWYLDDTTGSSNLGNSFKTTGSDPHNLRPQIKKLVEMGHAARAKGYEELKLNSLSATSKEMTLESNAQYYASKDISLSAENVGTYTVSVSNAPSGTIITDVNGKQKTTFTGTEKFKVKVPAKKVTGTSAKIKVTATASKTVEKAHEYKPSDSSMQSVILTTLAEEKTTKSVSLNLEISTSKVTIVKVDKATGSALAGAKLVLKDSKGKVVTSWTSTTNGHVIQNLSNGTYTVEEVSAPEGYKLNKEATKFTITDSKKEIKVKFYNEARSSVVNILKTDKSTGEPLAGATLVVKDSTGKEIAKFTTTKDPYVLVDLEDGTYTIEEVSAPAGYMLSSEKITFTINDENLSHQITFENYPEVVVPNTAANSMILTILGIVIIGTGIGFVYKNGKKAK